MEPKEGVFDVKEYKDTFNKHNKSDDDVQDHIARHCPPKSVKGIYCFPMFRYAIDWMYIVDYIGDEEPFFILKHKVARGEYRNEHSHEITEDMIKTIFSKLDSNGNYTETWHAYSSVIDYLRVMFLRIDSIIEEYGIENYADKINVYEHIDDTAAMEVFIELI